MSGTVHPIYALFQDICWMEHFSMSLNAFLRGKAFAVILEIYYLLSIYSIHPIKINFN